MKHSSALLTVSGGVSDILGCPDLSHALTTTIRTQLLARAHYIHLYTLLQPSENMTKALETPGGLPKPYSRPPSRAGSPDNCSDVDFALIVQLRTAGLSSPQTTKVMDQDPAQRRPYIVKNYWKGLTHTQCIEINKILPPQKKQAKTPVTPPRSSGLMLQDPATPTPARIAMVEPRGVITPFAGLALSRTTSPTCSVSIPPAYE